MSKTGIKLSNGAYDVIKEIVEKGLPALGTLYFALSQIWGFPNGEEVVGSIAAVTIFLGMVLALSRRAYTEDDSQYAGTIQINDNEDGAKIYRLEMAVEPEVLDTMQEVLFKVDGSVNE